MWQKGKKKKTLSVMLLVPRVGRHSLSHILEGIQNEVCTETEVISKSAMAASVLRNHLDDQKW